MSFIFAWGNFCEEDKLKREKRKNYPHVKIYSNFFQRLSVCQKLQVFHKILLNRSNLELLN